MAHAVKAPLVVWNAFILRAFSASAWISVAHGAINLVLQRGLP
jgi:hypothetical protein